MNGALPSAAPPALAPAPALLAQLRYLWDFALTGDKERVIDAAVRRYGRMVRLGPYLIMVGPEANELLAASGPDRVRPFDNPDFPTLASEDGEAHRLRRRVVMAAFHGPQLARYADGVLAALQPALEGTPGPVDLYPRMSRLALDALLRTMLGIRPGDPEERPFVEAYWPLVLREEGAFKRLRRRRVQAAREYMWRLLDALARRREEHPGPDALSALVAAANADAPAGVGQEDRLRYAYMLMDFGHGDLAIFLTYALAALALRPDLQDRLREEGARYQPRRAALGERELPLTASVLLEVERLYTPVAEMHRIAAADLEHGGHRIPGGTVLVASLFHSHRLPDLFRDPLSFDPDRFGPERQEQRHPFAVMGFGSGRHMCVAAGYCRMVATIVVHEVLARFRLEAGFDRLPEIDYRRTLQVPRAPVSITLEAR